MEGFGIPGAIPTIRHNPGDLRHSPHSLHPGGESHKNDVGTIDTDEHGWQDLDRQMELYAAQGLTINQMVNIYCGLDKDAPADTPNVDKNNVVSYRNFIISGMHLPGTTLLKEALNYHYEPNVHLDKFVKDSHGNA